MPTTPFPFWNFDIVSLFQRLESTESGLSSSQIPLKRKRFGANQLKKQKSASTLSLFVAQFKSPIILILFCATLLSFYLSDTIDALIILVIIMVSGILGFWQEKGASEAIQKLLSIVQIKCNVLRDGIEIEISIEDLVPGDVVILNAGDILPGDGILLESKDLFVDEAMLSGETFPVEKSVSILPIVTTLGKRTNSVWMGTHVVSGTAKVLLIHTGSYTEFGGISKRLRLRPEETDFERGIRRFGYLLMQVTILLVIGIFAINLYLQRPVIEAFLFSLALAVGLTPQLLPAIITINLSHGARRMAEKKVIVKRLASIENFGSMDIICSDKTGTLTEGVVQLKVAVGVEGEPSERVFLYAFLNSFYETGFTNPIDEAIRTYKKIDMSEFQKTDEIPYDFNRKRLSVLIKKDNEHIMLTKGAFKSILSICSSVELASGTFVPLRDKLDDLMSLYSEYGKQGFRVLGIAHKKMAGTLKIHKSDEEDMVFLGFLVLFDPPKPGISQTIESLKSLGVELKIITGDNKLVAQSISEQIGMKNIAMLTGTDLTQMSDEALMKRVSRTTIFAEIEPNQKERIILSLKKAGHVVGYIGDGINDASAILSADVGISVDSAVDVAKEASDIVLLEKDLSVLVEGVKEGRATFANTLKYVLMATSANFGNMFSMAGVSLFLPFLPLLPKQILLTNMLTDLPEMTIATDSVDQEMIQYPRRWDIQGIRKFMLTFGIVSSVFDFLTFGCLLFLLGADQEQFRTGWFLESVVSASIIVLVVRSRKPFFHSKPGKYLLLATFFIFVITLALPFTPFSGLLGFTPPSMYTLLLLGVIIIFYILTAEVMKKIFYHYNPNF